MITSIKTTEKLAEKLLEMDFLTDREKDMLKMRVGIDGYSSATLQEIGDKYGITRERVRQIGNSIIRRIKKHLPDQSKLAIKLFSKAWMPKYMVRKKQVASKKAVIQRNRTLVKKKYKQLVEYIVEFSKTGEGKAEIDSLFKELRIKYRKNKSLFEAYLVDELKRWRKRYTEIKKDKKQIKQTTHEENVSPVKKGEEERQQNDVVNPGQEDQIS